MIKSSASKVGNFLVSEGVSNDHEGVSFRVKVKLDVREPLRSFVSMVRVGKREIFLVCQVCRFLAMNIRTMVMVLIHPKI
jgi:hypothetical protein